MSVSINVNGLSLFHRGSGGFSRATVPDVCRTPPNAAPLPYPNVAFATTLVDGTVSVRADGGHSVAVSGSAFAQSVGGEAGTFGGVVSARHLDAATWLSHSHNVKIEGRAAERHTDKMLHNRGNAIDCGGAQNPPVPAAHTARARAARHSAAHFQLALVARDAHGPVEQFTAEIEGPVTRARKRPAVRRRKTSASASNVLFTNLPKGRYKVTVSHCCHLKWQKTVSAVALGSTQTVDVVMDVPSLLDEAKAKNRTIYSRANWYTSVDWATFQNEFGGGILYTGWSSRCGTSPTADFDTPQPGGAPSGFESAVDLQMGMRVKLMGTPLVWNASTPEWANAVVDAASYHRLYGTAAPPPGVRPPPAHASHHQLQQIAHAHTDAFIRAAMAKFRSEITTWVVCNEQCNMLFMSWARGIPFWRVWGEWNDGYDPRRPHAVPPLWPNIVHAFEVAHQTNPAAKLILNDYGNECWDGKHRHFVRRNDFGIRGEQFFHMAEYVASHLSHGARRRFAVGFQMHWHTGMSVNDLKGNLARYHRQLNLEVVVTELSVKMTNVRGVDPVRLYVELVSPTTTPDERNRALRQLGALYAAQSPLFASIYDVLLSAPNVHDIMHWGIDDMEEGPPDNPDTLDTLGYLFNAQTGCAAPYASGYFRKPAYVAVCESLRRSKRR